MAKRGNNEGTIYQLPSGSWRAQIYINGHRIGKTKKSKKEVQILIWERGAGETTASGSSSCAVAAAAVKNGLAEKNLTIKMQGGDLKISIDYEWKITMTGPASEVYTAKISEELLKLLKIYSRLQ